MRRLALLGLCLSLSGCGFSAWRSLPFVAGPDLYRPPANSENVRRVEGVPTQAAPLVTEPGNLWPPPPQGEPSLETLEREGGRLPHEVEPPPLPRGSSTPPRYQTPPAIPPIPPVPRAATPHVPPEPGAPVVQTPSGTGVITGGTGAYKTITLPNGTTAIVVPNGNGTSTVINSNGTVETIPTPK